MLTFGLSGWLFFFPFPSSFLLFSSFVLGFFCFSLFCFVSFCFVLFQFVLFCFISLRRMIQSIMDCRTGSTTLSKASSQFPVPLPFPQVWEIRLCMPPMTSGSNHQQASNIFFYFCFHRIKHSIIRAVFLCYI